LEIERAVVLAVRTMLGDRAAIALALEESESDSRALLPLLRSAETWIGRLQNESETPILLAEIVDRIDLSCERVRVALKLPTGEGGETEGAPLCVALSNFIPMQIKRRGVETRLVLDGEAASFRVDLPLLKAVARARGWSLDLISGAVPSVEALARREGIDGRSVRRLLGLGFLSSRIVEAPAEGREPLELTVIGLTRRTNLPLLWSEQEQGSGPSMILA